MAEIEELYDFANLRVLSLSSIFISFKYSRKLFSNGDGPTQTLLCIITYPNFIKWRRNQSRSFFKLSGMSYITIKFFGASFL